ncbi:ABC transporter permease [Halogeometricum borinquense]|uniref:ABC transporter permease n=1 Tax=Halogeometricum borinquense TaxID=60847 RepID=A0A482T900_9EURY|nr:ABC transporter permease [Halogeometricum borinquense]RYJ14354.1 ABC transporter permease [Halogeometricum borinquense]
MPDSVSSLLTRTQRERVQSEFDDVAPAKQRRDERKIRTRIEAGIDDFDLLVTYPDRQFELAFEDRTEADLRERLADAQLTIERIRTLHDIDRDAVVEAAQERQRSVSTDAAATLDEVRLRTHDEWRRRFEAEFAAEYRPTKWKRLSDALLKIGVVLLLIVSLLAVVAPGVTNGPVNIVGIVGAVLLSGGLGIVSVRAVKYDLLPAIRRLRADPSGALRAVWDQF